MPGDQRRRGARRHAARRARPLPDARDARRGAARRERAQPRAGDAPAHRGRGRGRHRHDRAVAGALPRRARPPARVRLRRVLPPRRSAVPRARRVRRRRAARERHRHGAHVRSGGARRACRAPTSQGTGVRSGFFAWVDGAPADGYRAPRAESDPSSSALRRTAGGATKHRSRSSPARSAHACSRRSCPNCPATCSCSRSRTSSSAATSASPACSPVPTSHASSPARPTDRRYLLPDVALSRGRFLDGTTVADLPRPVEIVPTDGASLVAALRAHAA